MINLASIKSIIKGFIDNDAFSDSEEHVQSSYTLPLLESLGWNASHWKINKNTDVKTAKRPDILLKGRGKGTIFVIESKEPRKSLDDRYPKTWTFPEQLCFYIGAEGVSWGILTNFKEWRIYNAHSFKFSQTFYKKLVVIDDDKNVASDEALTDFFATLEFHALNDNRGKISSDNVYYPKQEEIKSEFFENLKKWRASLRNYLYSNEGDISPEEIDNQTQRILDRLIFIDVCYDKKILLQDYLGAVLFSELNYYDELKRKFVELDEKFNSELFSKARCDHFHIPNDVSESIIKGINHIDFSLLSVHIIGEVYEDYLGELLNAGKTKITTNESKAHLKRKEHGIYYTPDYIVNYIVDNTIGELLNTCNTEKDIERIKVIDPSCGSGSFLIRAFEVFYEAYKRVGNHKRKSEIFYEIEIRKKILLHNIYGIDLDERAVEIAKLNLFLKALEGLQESHTAGRKILPNLSLNIRCGNSLISGKYEEDESGKNQLSLIFDKGSEYKNDIDILIDLKKRFYREEDNDAKEKLIHQVHVYEERINKYLNNDLKTCFKHIDKIKPFNFEVSFCEVMKDGGFDCIIGNPPYLKLTVNNTEQEYFNYYNHNFETIQGGSSKNLFQLFIERFAKLSPHAKFFSFIVPEAMLTTSSNKILRDVLLQNMSMKSFAVFNHFVFDQATIGSTIFIANNKKRTSNIIKRTLGKGGSIVSEKNINISKNDVSWEVGTDNEFTDLLTQISKDTVPLKKLVVMAKGMVVQNRTDVLESGKTKTNLPFILGKNMGRYSLEYTAYATYKNLTIIGGTNKLSKHIQVPRLLIRRTGNYICATYSNEPELVESTIYIVTPIDKTVRLKFLLALLNSDVITFYFQKRLITNAQGFPQVLMGQLEQLPIPKVKADISDRLINLADDMLKLHKHPDKNKVKIDAANLEINDMAYKLYGISDKNRKVIEQNSTA